MPKDSHWSLSVIMNPSEVSLLIDSDPRNKTCILFFDSLNAHSVQNTRLNLIRWLNAEWNMNYLFLINPFSNAENKFHIRTPESK